MANQLPDALESFDSLLTIASRGRLAVFVDYDGTLTPIQARPQDATMPASARGALRRVAERYFTAVVTGRGLADVQAMVQLPGLTYAANHGLEIEGPGVRFEPDPSLRERFAAVRPEIDALVEGVDGVVVEHKGLSIAVHVRLVDAEHVVAIEAGIDDVLAREPTLRKGTGKRVFELRPALDWHKGAAVRWLCERLAKPGGEPLVPLFIGDDLTDEDAQRQVQSDGIGIFVGEPGWDTAARFRLADPTAVEQLLRRLAAATPQGPSDGPRPR